MNYIKGEKVVNNKTAEIVKIVKPALTNNGECVNYLVECANGCNIIVNAEDLKPYVEDLQQVCAKSVPSSFESLCQSMLDTYKKKNADYGNSFDKSIDHYGNVAFLTRASDKFNRAENLLMGKEQQVADEKVTDTLMDLANYCVMMVSYLKNKSK